MPKTKITKSKVFTLVIDEDRNTVLNILYGICSQPDVIKKFDEATSRLKVFDQAMSLLGEIADKCHPLGWCHDPDCPWIDPNK